jgi:hypothetical protein
MDRRTFQFDVKHILAAITIIAVCLAVTRSALLTVGWIAATALFWYIDSSLETVDREKSKPSLGLRLAGAFCGAIVGLAAMLLVWISYASDYLSFSPAAYLGICLGAVVGLTSPKIAAGILLAVFWI